MTIRNQGTGFNDSYHERTEPASYQHIDFAIADACPALETEDGLMTHVFFSAACYWQIRHDTLDG